MELNHSPEAAYEVEPERPSLPAFDDESIHRAQPAVLLRDVSAHRRSRWPLSTLLLLLITGVAGGAIALFVVTQYLRRSTTTTTLPAVTTPAPPTAQTATPAPSPNTMPAGDASQTSAAPANEGSRSDGRESATNERAEANTKNIPERENERANTENNQNTVHDDGAEFEAERVAGDDTARGEEMSETESRRALRGALDSWIASTNTRDIDRQMELYAGRVNAFYLSRNASRRDVRAEKTQLFGRAKAVDVRVGEPEIKFGRNGKTAAMRFRKDYEITGDGQSRRGAVLQELRWRLTKNGWRIVSERDLRVLK